jgi:hypothetical protein
VRWLEAALRDDAEGKPPADAEHLCQLLARAREGG